MPWDGARALGVESPEALISAFAQELRTVGPEVALEVAAFTRR
jgi:hypothetical protein